LRKAYKLLSPKAELRFEPQRPLAQLIELRTAAPER